MNRSLRPLSSPLTALSPLSVWDHVSARFAAMTRDGVRDRGAAMVFSVLFMIMLAGVSIVLLSVLVGQIAPSLSAQQGTRAGYSAQAGLQIGLGSIRAAASAPDAQGKVYGNRSALPCTVEGFADGAGGQLPFEVEMRYYTLNPANRTAAWLDANDLACVAGSGVVTQPRYALVIAAGSSVNDANNTYDRDRTMSAIYEFNVTNVNIPGGRILNGSLTHCLRAQSAANDSRIVFVPIAQCTNDALELWIYDRDWKLKLASTTVPNTTALCITGPVNGNATQDARLRVCQGPTAAARWNQLWSWVGGGGAGGNWRGQQQSINNGISNFCLNVPTSGNLTGGFLLARSNGCSSTLLPTAEVGPGAAGFATQQIVNFRQFGRCADVTNENVTFSYMIVYPCKQDPRGTGAGILWNHKWAYQEPAALAGSLPNQEISVLNLGETAQRRCLTTQPNTSSSRYVVFQVCTGDARQKWNRVAQGATYENSWLFIDTYGRCLTAAVTDLHENAFAKMTTVACNGTTDQKWNAPPNSTTATFGGYREIAN